MEELLILVDNNDQQVGKLEKLLVHQQGVLHRAFSVFIFNTKGELLLQQRADGKYHSPGLWSNTCCSHPKPGEELKDAVKRRLKEEMGLHSSTEFIFNFIYKASFENGLTEHEFDHVFFGIDDAIPVPDTTEVKDWRYIHLKDLKEDLEKNPLQYTVWLKICFEKVIEYLENNSDNFLSKAS